MTRWRIWTIVLALIGGYLYLPAINMSAGQTLVFLLLLLCLPPHFFGAHHDDAEPEAGAKEDELR